MPVPLPDGSVLYKYPDNINSVTFNGRALNVEDLLEILVCPDGWGRILTLRALDTADVRREGETKLQVDGVPRNFTYWGKVVLT